MDDLVTYETGQGWTVIRGSVIVEGTADSRPQTTGGQVVAAANHRTEVGETAESEAGRQNRGKISNAHRRNVLVAIMTMRTGEDYAVLTGEGGLDIRCNVLLIIKRNRRPK